MHILSNKYIFKLQDLNFYSIGMFRFGSGSGKQNDSDPDPNHFVRRIRIQIKTFRIRHFGFKLN